MGGRLGHRLRGRNLAVDPVAAAVVGARGTVAGGAGRCKRDSGLGRPGECPAAWEARRIQARMIVDEQRRSEHTLRPWDGVEAVAAAAAAALRTAHRSLDRA